MENSDNDKDILIINGIITDSQNNLNHLEEIISIKRFNSETKEYILCQIDYFNLIIFYHKKLKEIQGKLSYEYIKIMKMILQKIKNKLEYILSNNFNPKNIEYEYEKSISVFKNHDGYYDEQIAIFETLNNEIISQ